MNQHQMQPPKTCNEEAKEGLMKTGEPSLYVGEISMIGQGSTQQMQRGEFKVVIR